MIHKLSIFFGMALLGSILPTSAQAASFSNLYVFGDSLSDTGNISGFTGGIFPPTPYVDGRFSNGDIWIDYLAQDLGLTSPTPFASVSLGTPSTNGINFAFGGATTGTSNTISSQFLSLSEQVQAFSTLSGAGVPLDPNGLYAIWAGANDYLPTSSSFTPYSDPNTPVSNIETAIANLANLGAKNFLVVNLPDLGATPWISGRGVSSINDVKGYNPNGIDPNGNLVQQFSQLTRSHNQLLSQSVSNLRSQFGPEVTIAEFDVYAAFNEVLNNPSNFGFSNVADPCIYTGMCAISPSTQAEYFFWDNNHPTTRGHRITANYAFTALTEEFSKPHPQPVTATEPASGWGILAVGIVCVGGTIHRYRGNKNRKIG
ncbi:MAG: SGNH/GDSL hydrolase family protein [Jaaginema sp. PMC 1080.18]|nr:SGNH/GDSL hydrolase family protein [Jaaginema sp. PMC 1080.18]MEC4867708.1 SGNH/GDSL hydrolase family protein [Jaaginema sp. PMC 1078.18]